MWIRKRFDIGWNDLFHALAACIRPNPNASREIEHSLSGYGHASVFLSVRSALDALLTALNLEQNDEILISALTVSGMVRVIEEHGLVPVPLDVETDSLLPSVEALSNAITSRSKILIIAHLFGNDQDISELLERARDSELFVVEDKAQAFMGVPSMHFDSNMVLYSFGLIKTATALGAGIALAKDSRTLQLMNKFQARHPIQSNVSYFNRVLKYGFLKLLMYRLSFGIVVSTLDLLRIDFDSVVKKSAKGFHDKQLLDQLRHRPSTALLSVLHRRLTLYSLAASDDAWQRGERLRNRLEQTCTIPGSNATKRGYWVFPVSVDEPERTVKLLREHGFDGSMQGSMIAVQPPVDRPQLTPLNSIRLLEKIVFIPFYDGLPNKAIERIVQLISESSADSRQLEPIENR